jgi:hypothetical protein
MDIVCIQGEKFSFNTFKTGKKARFWLKKAKK